MRCCKHCAILTCLWCCDIISWTRISLYNISIYSYSQSCYLNKIELEHCSNIVGMMWGYVLGSLGIVSHWLDKTYCSFKFDSRRIRTCCGCSNLFRCVRTKVHVLVVRKSLTWRRSICADVALRVFQQHVPGVFRQKTMLCVLQVVEMYVGIHNWRYKRRRIYIYI